MTGERERVLNVTRNPYRMRNRHLFPILLNEQEKVILHFLDVLQQATRENIRSNVDPQANETEYELSIELTPARIYQSFPGMHALFDSHRAFSRRPKSPRRDLATTASVC
jgi:hypothetical protein